MACSRHYCRVRVDTRLRASAPRHGRQANIIAHQLTASQHISPQPKTVTSRYCRNRPQSACRCRPMFFLSPCYLLRVLYVRPRPHYTIRDMTSFTSSLSLESHMPRHFAQPNRHAPMRRFSMRACRPRLGWRPGASAPPRLNVRWLLLRPRTPAAHDERDDESRWISQIRRATMQYGISRRSVDEKPADAAMISATD